MTIEESKEYISSIVDTYEICHDAEHTSVAVSIGVEDAKALEMAIASLEAWEKVRQDIQTETDDKSNNMYFNLGMLGALAIINKHLQERSDKE